MERHHRAQADRRSPGRRTGPYRTPVVVCTGGHLQLQGDGGFRANLRANPRKISMASFGSGSASHLAGERFKLMAGVDRVDVPRNSAGGAAMITDLIGGQVQVGF